MPPLNHRTHMPNQAETPASANSAAIPGAPALYRPQLPAMAILDLPVVNMLVRGPSAAASRRICTVLYFLSAVCLAVIVGQSAAVAFALMSGFDTALKVTIIGASAYLFILASTPTIVAIQRWRQDHPAALRIRAPRATAR